MRKVFSENFPVSLIFLLLPWKGCVGPPFIRPRFFFRQQHIRLPDDVLSETMFSSLAKRECLLIR